MKDLFLELLHKQPSGQVYFGGTLSKEGSKDGGKDVETGKPESLTLRPSGDYSISSEKRCFVALYSEKTGMEKIDQNLINQHLAYLRSLLNEGRLIFAGAYVTGDRGLLVISAESLEEAGEIVKRDPVFQAGYYGKFDIEAVTGLKQVKTDGLK